MLTKEQVASFFENGYILVPGVLKSDEVAQLRSFLLPRFSMPETPRCAGDTNNILFDVYSRYPEMRWLLFHETSIRVLRSLLGDDYVVLREAAAHFDFYSNWHKDTTSQEGAGKIFQWEKDYLMVEVAYYLQDNTPEYGGGLEVQPGSHCDRDSYVRLGRLGRVRRAILNLLSPKRKQVSLPSKAGDLLIFDFRINHRASQGRYKIAAHDQKKLAIFLACSRSGKHVGAYHEFIHSRPNYVYLRDFKYPADLMEQAKNSNVILA